MPRTNNNNTSSISHRVKDAAILTGVSQDTITNMVISGQLKAIKISPKGNGQRHMTLIPHSELVRVFGVE